MNEHDSLIRLVKIQTILICVLVALLLAGMIAVGAGVGRLNRAVLSLENVREQIDPEALSESVQSFREAAEQLKEIDVEAFSEAAGRLGELDMDSVNNAVSALTDAGSNLSRMDVDSVNQVLSSLRTVSEKLESVSKLLSNPFSR